MRGGGYLGIPVSRCHYLIVVINSNLLQVYPTKYNAFFNVNGIRLFGTWNNKSKWYFWRYVGGFILDSTCSTHNSRNLFFCAPQCSIMKFPGLLTQWKSVWIWQSCEWDRGGKLHCWNIVKVSYYVLFWPGYWWFTLSLIDKSCWCAGLIYPLLTEAVDLLWSLVFD